jgi:hypothetical protein
MAHVTAAPAEPPQTEFDPTVGFDDLFIVLVLFAGVGLALLVAVAAGALWLSRRQHANERGVH